MEKAIARTAGLRQIGPSGGTRPLLDKVRERREALQAKETCITEP
jgi:hypothetical protein